MTDLESLTITLVLLDVTIASAMATSSPTSGSVVRTEPEVMQGHSVKAGIVGGVHVHHVLGFHEYFLQSPGSGLYSLLVMYRVQFFGEWRDMYVGLRLRWY